MPLEVVDSNKYASEPESPLSMMRFLSVEEADALSYACR